MEKPWKTIRDYLYIIFGSVVEAFAMSLFLVPALLSSGGISGLAQIINHFNGWPVGLLTLIGNVPLFLLGWRYLGGKRFAFRTISSLVIFSLTTDLLSIYLPKEGFTTDPVLNSIFGGVLLGVGMGLIYRGRGTSGGSDIICRMMNHYLGIPYAQGFLIADGLVVIASGFAFGWDRALYALVVIYISGIAAETTSEGSSVFRAAMIVTIFPKEIATKIGEILEHGSTILPGTGGYAGGDRPVLYCVLNRSEVHQLKALVGEIDPNAFVVIGQAHEVLGEGFRPLKEQ
jgi:uncharacterized membrane-anchored protein YitT (DUF2179 family)